MGFQTKISGGAVQLGSWSALLGCRGQRPRGEGGRALAGATRVQSSPVQLRNTTYSPEGDPGGRSGPLGVTAVEEFPRSLVGPMGAVDRNKAIPNQWPTRQGFSSGR